MFLQRNKVIILELTTVFYWKELYNPGVPASGPRLTRQYGAFSLHPLIDFSEEMSEIE